MKKVFAILSVFALTIACVALSLNSPAKADELFTEDPTLEDYEIPMYIMDSIYTTFPQYYDYVTGGDEMWAGASRMYPWNETRLEVKQMDEAGKYTGKVYAIYFAGSLNGNEAGAGNNLLFYDVDAEGKVELKRMMGGKWSGAAAMDPSLSHMRTNISDYDAYFVPKALWASTGSSSEGDTFANRLFVFDAEGRMIRGELGSVAYQKAGTDGALENVIAPEYCYVDGEVTKMEDGVVCDKVKVQVTDEDGNVVLDEETGEPVLVEGEDDDILYKRYLWQWYPAEVVEADDFVGVNDVAYLSEGWDAMKWDYAEYEEESDGYICIAFLPSENSTFGLTAEQLAVYAKTCEDAGLEAPTDSTTRACAEVVWVPAHGYSFDFGYLDKGKNNLYACCVDMFISGMKFGRQVDEEGKGMAYQMTYNFSAKPLYATDKVVNGVSYQVMEGQNTIEVLQGEVFNPAKNIVYSGISNYWSIPGDLTSYKADASVLEMYIYLDGTTQVAPPTGYTSFEAMVADFIADWNAFADENGLGHITATPATTQTDDEIVNSFYNPLGWDCASLNAVEAGKENTRFTTHSVYGPKWSWMFDYIYQHAGSQQASLLLSNGAVSSPGFFRDALWGFLAQSPQRSISGTWAHTCGSWDNGVATEWLDARSNKDLWDQFAIDTSTAAVDTNYNVSFKVINTETGIESTFALKYVVVDEYTPILKVNKNNLIYAPTQVGEKLEMPAINPYDLVTAYNGKYNGKSILGDDITYKVHFDTDLDFEKVTEGEHQVTARVYSASGAKFVEKTFNVSVEDMTAPRAFAVSQLVLAYGSYFTPEMGVTYAYDAVDGNLMNNDLRGWCTDVSSTVVNVQKAGTYRVVVEIGDRSGNTTTLQYNVIILPQQNMSGISDDLEATQALVKKQASDLDAKLDEIQGEVANLKAEIQKQAEAKASKCGSKSVVLVSFLAAAGLLFVFLRKRH